MFIIGTAGHIDHGKSSLVQALTGINPDRLPEEQKRGMTIDLGFAFLPLSRGETVGIVDVPGHKDLMKNAIAGMWGIDAALLVIAADDGWMPQTEDHLRLLHLFHIAYGIAVITKIDLVQPDWLEMVEEDVRGKLQGTRLAGAPIIRVSAKEGTNLDLLHKKIEELVEQISPKRDIGKPRLPVDRVFTVKGSGTVVTGTLVDGSLAEGDNVFVYPENVSTRIRTLETYKSKTGKSAPGTRTALNLVGLEKQEIQRGDVVFGHEGQVRVSRMIDAQIETVPSLTMPVKSNTEIVVYLGTREVPGRILMLTGEALKAGTTTFCQFRFKENVASRAGDHFVFKKPTEPQTLGGGTVLDPMAGRHKVKDTGVIAWLERRASLNIKEMVLTELEKDKYAAKDDLLMASPFSADEVAKAVQALGKERKLVTAGPFLLDAVHWQAQTEELMAALAEQAAQRPLEKGIAQADLQNRLKLPKEAFDALVNELTGSARITREGSTIAIAGRKPTLSTDQDAVRAKIMALFADKTNPPTKRELAERAPGSEKVLRFMVTQKMLAELPEGVLLEYQHYSQIKQKILDFLKANGRISIPQVREQIGLTRKYILPLLAKLDEEGVTRREGDERVLGKAAG